MRILSGCRKLILITIFACIGIAALSLFGGGKPSNSSPPTLTTLPSLTRTSEVVNRSGLITTTSVPDTVYPTATDVPISIPAAIIRPINSLTYYVQRTANVRSCASSTCDKLGLVTVGASMTVTGIVEGETVTASNSTWYQVQYSGRQAFIYSAYLADHMPAATQQPAQAAQPAAVQQPPPVDHPSNATALCNDGTYSYAVNHRGACSHHGGVAHWY